jgi:DNA polymerase-3 subunit beta
MSVPAKVEGEGVEVVYNIRYIEDFLQCVSGDEVVIDLIDNSSAGVFKDATDPKFLHLIMPVKLQS